VKPALVEFGREVCGNLEAAEAREWLVTNGIGGFASGTVASSLTRRYHGLLIAALQPPVGRMQLVASLDEQIRYAGVQYAMATHQWSSGVIDPRGFINIEDFRLEGMRPVWTFALADALLEKRIWMRQGENTTYIQYTLLRASAPLEMECKALVNYRDFHSSTHAGNWKMKIDPVENGVRILAFDGAKPFFLRSANASCEPRHEWYRNCFMLVEKERGLDDHEDHLFAALFRLSLNPGATATFVVSTEEKPAIDPQNAAAQQVAYEAKLLRTWQSRNQEFASQAPDWIPQLVLAADQFIVKRSLPAVAGLPPLAGPSAATGVPVAGSAPATTAQPADPDGRSIIAGYHWFGDWGRDTMIALPGLTLATGRPEVARQILLAYARYVDGGMLPNNFPDAGSSPEYNTVDAALWYFEAVRQYFAATQDTETLRSLFPVLAQMISAHVSGTRYNIHVDTNDGLLYAGQTGVQLTWMDAKIGNTVITPRTGKAVEINALWINALETISGFAQTLTKAGGTFRKLSAQARASFQKFWNEERGCCYDVIDAPATESTSGREQQLRPNQIFAVSLPVSPLTQQQQRAVVDACAKHLLTSYGLRSLAPGERGYRGRYGGSPLERDSSYHQGTVWGWLIGPFALAYLRVYGDRAMAMRFLEPLGISIHMYGLGTLGEIFEGDPPFTPHGCIAQAWTVGEVLRAARELLGS
jgi:glycogen debranching enzyme